MKPLSLCYLSMALILVSNVPVIAQEEEAPKAPAAKQGPNPGQLEIQVTSGDKVKTFEHPAKALTEISRAVSREKKAKEGEELSFETVLKLNDQTFTFSDPEAALEACKALSNAMRELPRMRMGLGDLGEIPEVEPEEQPAANTPGAKPMPPRNQAAAMAEVRRRVNAALQRQLIGTSGGRVSMRIPTPQQIQQTINQEVEKARQEGLLPANTGANAGAGFAGGDPREAKKEAIVQTLAFAFGKADEPATEDDKPAEGDTPKPEEK